MKLFGSNHVEPEADHESTVEGERAISPVNRGLTLQARVTNWLGIGAAILLAAIILYKYYSGLYQDYQQEKAVPKDVSHTATTVSLPPLVIPAPEPEVHKASMQASDAALPPLTAPSNQDSHNLTNGPTNQARPKTTTEIVRDRRLKRELRFTFDGKAYASSTSSADHTETSEQADLVTKPVMSMKAMGVESVRPGAGRAYMLANPTLTIPQGRVIPCNVLPAIDTTLQGNVTCIVDENVRSADNKVVLMNRGTQCFGKQEGGVAQGKRRVGIIWTRCLTDEYVVIPIESPAADSLGRPGIAGQVDNHFWDRFGAAIALSLISDIGPYLIATQQGGSNNTTVAFPSIGTGPQQVMTEVMKGTMGIPPTLTAPQGSRVLIFLAGDLDFRDVYTLEATK